MNEEQKQPKRTKKAWSIANVMRWLSRKSERSIEVEIPIGFMNCGVSTCNNFIADTNDSSRVDASDELAITNETKIFYIACYSPLFLSLI